MATQNEPNFAKCFNGGMVDLINPLFNGLKYNTSDILLIARIFPRSYGAWKNTTQLTKYPCILYVKPLNMVYLFVNNKFSLR